MDFQRIVPRWYKISRKGGNPIPLVREMISTILPQEREKLFLLFANLLP
jgi:hypothetical protein